MLRTRPGTRPLLPEFGCRLQEPLFRPLLSSVCGQMTYFVTTWNQLVTALRAVAGHDGNKGSRAMASLILRWLSSDMVSTWPVAVENPRSRAD
jgi:hypothetical protein